MSAFEYHGTVRWSETDASGRFHFAAALIWAEGAEHTFYRTAVPDFGPAAMPRRAVSATFHAPFQAGDAYHVALWVEKIGNSSVSYAWRICRGEQVAVEGQHTVVHVDDEGQPTPLPDALRSALSAYLRGDRA